MPLFPKCPSCGARPSAPAEFCALCGNPLRAGTEGSPVFFRLPQTTLAVLGWLLAAVFCVGPFAAVPGIISARRELRRMDSLRVDLPWRGLVAATIWVNTFVLLAYAIGIAVFIASLLA